MMIRIKIYDRYISVYMFYMYVIYYSNNNNNNNELLGYLSSI